MSTVWSSCLAISKACSRTGKNLEKNSRCDCTERLTFQTGWDFSALKADRWRWIGWKSIHHDCGGETEFGMIAHELFRFKNWKHSVILTGNGCTVKKKKRLVIFFFKTERLLTRCNFKNWQDKLLKEKVLLHTKQYF